MSVSVFFSNQNIQIVVGKCNGNSIHIDRLIESPMPDNAILNGVVVEGGAEAISYKLKEMWKANKIKGEADLIINSPQFIANRIEMPILTGSKMSDYIAKQTQSDEFARFEEPVKGWYIIGTNSKEKTQSVVTEVAERTSIENYIKIFSTAGITLNSVHDGVSLATEMLSKCIKGATAIYIIRDAQMLVTILYENGKYYYNSTRRIFQQPGTQEFAEEIRSTISGIRQFAKSQHLESTINDVYFAGMEPDEVSMLQSYLSGIDHELQVHGTAAPSHVHFRKWNDRFSAFIYPVAGLCIPPKNYSLIKALRKNDESYTRKKELFKKSIPLIVLTGILALITAFLMVVYFNAKSELEQIENYNHDISVMQASMEYDALVLKAGREGAMQGGVNTLEDVLASYPVPDSSINEKILEAAKGEKVEVEFSSYDSGSGVFATTASSYEVENINKFIAKLLAMDIFEDVDYTGYEWNESDGTWQIKVICTLSAGNDKEGE